MSLPTAGRTPGVIFQALVSPNQILLPAGTAVVAFVGSSALTKPVVNEVVTRGATTPTHGTSIGVAHTSGTTVSDTSPATTATGLALTVNIDGDGMQAITVDDGGTHTGAAVAAAMQVAIRALTANYPANQASINAVTVVYGTTYTVTSGSYGLGSTVDIDGADETLKLATDDGGTDLPGTPYTSTSGGETLTLNLNSDGAKTITLAASATGALVAADIQAKVRALTAFTNSHQYAYTNFTASYTAGVYKLSSGTVGSSSTVVVTTGTDATHLKIGVTAGGTEAAGTGNTLDTLSAGSVASIDAMHDINGVNYFSGVDFALYGANQIDWSLGGNVPATGVKYYTSYEIPKAGSDFEVKTVYNQAQAAAIYGSEDIASNELSVASNLFFENGGSQLMMVQTQGTSFNQFMAAFDLLQTEQVDIINVMATPGMSGFTSLFPTVKGRIFQLSNPIEAAQRMAFLSAAIGTSTAQYAAYTAGLAYNRLVLTAPDSFLMTVNGTQSAYPAYFMNAAILGFIATPGTPVSQPCTNQEMFGIDEVSTKYLRSQTVALLESGVLVVQSLNGIVKVVQGITTDVSSTENNEITGVRIGDYYGKTLSTVLTRMYVGTTINATTPSTVAGTIQTVGNDFVASNVLISADAPVVTRNKGNPTALDVYQLVTAVAPLNFIEIQFTLTF